MTTTLETPTRTEQTSAANAADQTQIWRRYALAGQGSPLEGELVERYLPLVKTVAGRIALTLPNHIDVQDLQSAGLIGLLDALRRFDPNSGAIFESYARLRIRGAILDELRRLDWVPRSVRDKARRVQDAMQELEQRHGSIPTETQMAKSLDMSVEDYQSLLDEIKPATFVCLDSARRQDSEEGSTNYESVQDDHQPDPSLKAAQHEMAQMVVDRLEVLPEAQRKVLALYYFEDMRLREIAEVFGVTESRICQIHSQAILAIKGFLKRQDPEALNPVV
ncbi:MAG: FliA/WhiG family RNA polymerase sigma factor [Limisphaerales bacterium]|jgi:RNA polymerase sigma factor for flagellar operon FliA